MQRCALLIIQLVDSFKAIFPVLSMSQTTHIELEPNDCISLVKYLGVKFTPQLFSTVYIQNKVR